MERTDRNLLPAEPSLSLPSVDLLPGLVSQFPYGVQARYYDYEYRSYTDDVPFYLQMLRAEQGCTRILELGVGTGRVALPLAEAGFHVIGVDLSAPMLNRARKRRREATREVQQRLRIVQADFLTWSPPHPFHAVLAPFSFLCLLPTRALRQAAIRRAAEMLEPGGLLISDVFRVMPYAEQALGEDGALPQVVSRASFLLPPYGHRVEKVTKERRFPRAGVQQVRYEFIERDWEETRVFRTLQVEFLLGDVPELELLEDYLAAGLAIEQLAGDYQGRPPGPKSGRLLVTGRKVKN